jgi:uncharacterized protein
VSADATGDASDPLQWLTGGEAAWRLQLLVQPNARRSECAGVVDGRLKLRICAPAVQGSANEALLRYLAERLRLPKASLQLSRGQASRRKTVVITAAIGRDALLRALTGGEQSAG